MGTQHFGELKDRDMKRYKIYVAALFTLFIKTIDVAVAQGGDQILDGIGETGMVARYLFNGDLKDWSRNGLHGKFQGEKVSFVADKQFTKALSLAGDSNRNGSEKGIPGDHLPEEGRIEKCSFAGCPFKQVGASGYCG